MLRDILLYPFTRFFEAPDLGLGYLNYDSLDSKIVYIPFFLLFIFGTSGYMFCKKNNSPEIGYTFSETKEIVASMFEISTFASQFYNETYFSILVCGFIYLLVHFLCGESYTPIRVEYITQFQPIEDSVLLLTPRKAQDEIYVLAIPINSTLDPLKHVKNSSNHVSEFHALFEDYKVPRVDGFQHVYELPTSTTCNIYIITYNTEKYSKTSCAIRYPWGYRSPAEIMLIEYDYQVLALVFLFFVVELMNLINMPEKQGLHSFFIIFLIIVWAGLFISTRIRIEIDESLIAVFEYATKLRFIVILAAIFYTMTGPPFAPVEWEISNYIFICLLIFLGKSITADLVILAPTVFAVIAFRMDRQRALSILRYRRINIIKQSNEINCDPDSLNKYYRHLRISLIVFLIVLIEFVFALSQHYWYHANLFCLLTVVFYVAYYFIIFRYNIADKEDKSTKDIGK